MMKMTRIVSVGLLVVGIVEIAFMGAGAGLYGWYLLLALWVMALLIRFILAGVDAFKAVFAMGPDGAIAVPEYEKKMASFARTSNREDKGPSSRKTFGNGNQNGTENFINDDIIIPIYPEKDPFGELYGF